MAKVVGAEAFLKTMNQKKQQNAQNQGNGYKSNKPADQQVGGGFIKESGQNKQK